MNFEHKDEIIMNLKDYNAGRKVTRGTHAFESKLEELDQVYDLAEIATQHLHNLRVAEAKAEEYEAKAKAWDRTQALLEKCTHQTPGDDYEVDWHEFEIKIDEVISDYESGEYDA